MRLHFCELFIVRKNADLLVDLEPIRYLSESQINIFLKFNLHFFPILGEFRTKKSNYKANLSL